MKFSFLFLYFKKYDLCFMVYGILPKIYCNVFLYYESRCKILIKVKGIQPLSVDNSKIKLRWKNWILCGFPIDEYFNLCVLSSGISSKFHIITNILSIRFESYLNDIIYTSYYFTFVSFVVLYLLSIPEYDVKKKYLYFNYNIKKKIIQTKFRVTIWCLQLTDLFLLCFVLHKTLSSLAKRVYALI